jgi:site-specific recombinase XerD
LKDITNYLEQSDIDAMLEVAHIRRDRDYLLMKLLWQTGVRVDELLHIRPRDIEHHNERINIVNAKGNKQRRVPVKPETLKELELYIAAENIEADSPIFKNKKGDAYTQQHVRRIIKPYGSLINKNVHPHTFRHSFAINMIRHGCDLRRLQQVLGHSSLNVTAVYLQFNDRDLQDVYEGVPF